MSDDEFETQLRQEAEENERKEKLKAGKLKVDPDGTVYDWDEEKKAWFPRVDEDFIAKYQMSYGVETPSGEQAGGENVPPSTSDPAYAEWYNKYYTHFDGTGNAIDTNSKEYKEWYDYYYGDHSKGGSESETTAETQDANSKHSKSTESETNEETKESEGPQDVDTGEPAMKRQCPEPGIMGSETAQQQSYEEYYAQYYQKYPSTPAEESSEEKLDPSHPDYWEQYHRMQLPPHTDTDSKVGKGDEESKAEGKKANEADKGKKKKAAPEPAVPPSWFEMDEAKNTTVYVAGLPPDMTEESFVALMNKCGLIMYDPRTKKPKVKLYKDRDGSIKGDGRCCYIKQESVDLALQFLDGSDVDGYKIAVEVAKFTMKGDFDPKKKKKKLTNAEKKKFKEKQEKLFDWRPDKPRGVRDKNEKVVIIKNFFNPNDFDTNPALLNELSQDLREECQTFGEVKKVTIYDRHPDGVASVAFKEAEEADVCIKALDRRYFAGKRLLAETWDGKSKYEVEETEEQRQERLKKWKKYLEEGQANKAKVGQVDAVEEGQARKDEAMEPTVEEGAVQGIVDDKQEEGGASSFEDFAENMYTDSDFLFSDASGASS